MLQYENHLPTENKQAFSTQGHAILILFSCSRPDWKQIQVFLCRMVPPEKDLLLYSTLLLRTKSNTKTSSCLVHGRVRIHPRDHFWRRDCYEAKGLEAAEARQPRLFI